MFSSKDVASVAILLLAFFMISKLSSFVARQVSELYKTDISRIGLLNDLSITSCSVIVREVLINLFICVFPLMFAVCIVSVVATGVQTRFNFSMEKLKPKFSKFNPIEGFKRILSLRSLVQLVKSLLKIVVITVVIVGSIRSVLAVTPDMLFTDMAESTRYLVSSMMNMVYKICLLFLAVAVLDFAYEKYDYEQRLKMTKQEVKDEYKQVEGDPQVKSKMRERARRLSMNRMIQAIPTADVIVRNPTHYAIAIKYDIDKDFAPTVVAKGKDKVAERIILEAEKYNILTTENRPLARTLYETVEINDYIPQELYQAVAEVMAWVYKVRKKEIVS